MYLSRVELDPTRRSTMAALAAPQKLHGAVESAFTGERRRRLWRLDRLGERLYLLLLSEDAPELSGVVAESSEEMQKAIDMLSEVKESIINAYEIKTGLSRAKLSHLMDAETWMNANKAVELGFADDLLFKADGESATAEDSFVFSRRAVTNSLMSKVKSHHTPSEPAKSAGTPISELEKRLALIKP